MKKIKLFFAILLIITSISTPVLASVTGAHDKCHTHCSTAHPSDFIAYWDCLDGCLFGIGAQQQSL